MFSSSPINSKKYSWLRICVALYPLKVWDLMWYNLNEQRLRSILMILVSLFFWHQMCDWCRRQLCSPLHQVWQSTLNCWPGSRHVSLWAGTTYCHLLHVTPQPLAAQMAGCSLVRFLWCMLLWRTSSSERANFFWQLGQRQVNGFSPDKKWTNKEKKKPKKIVL